MLATGEKVQITLPLITIGGTGTGANINASLITDTTKALNGGSALAAKIAVTDLAIAVSGSITVCAH